MPNQGCFDRRFNSTVTERNQSSSDTRTSSTRHAYLPVKWIIHSVYTYMRLPLNASRLSAHPSICWPETDTIQTTRFWQKYQVRFDQLETGSEGLTEQLAIGLYPFFFALRYIQNQL